MGKEVIPKHHKARINSLATENDRTQKYSKLLFKFMKAVETKIVLRFLRRSGTNSLTLDMGCGEGIHFEHFNHPVGLDISSVRLARAKNRYPDVPTIIAVAEHLPFRSGIFHIVAGIDIVEHVFSLKDMISESRRVLTQRGSLIISRCNKYIESIGGLLVAFSEGNRTMRQNFIVPVPEEHIHFPERHEIVDEFGGVTLDYSTVPFPFLPFAFNKTEFWLLQK